MTTSSSHGAKYDFFERYVTFSGANEARVTTLDERRWHLSKEASQPTVMGRGYFRQ